MTNRYKGRKRIKTRRKWPATNAGQERKREDSMRSELSDLSDHRNPALRVQSLARCFFAMLYIWSCWLIAVCIKRAPLLHRQCSAAQPFGNGVPHLWVAVISTWVNASVDLSTLRPLSGVNPVDLSRRGSTICSCKRTNNWGPHLASLRAIFLLYWVFEALQLQALSDYFCQIDC